MNIDKNEHESVVQSFESNLDDVLQCDHNNSKCDGPPGKDPGFDPLILLVLGSICKSSIVRLLRTGALILQYKELAAAGDASRVNDEPPDGMTSTRIIELCAHVRNYACISPRDFQNQSLG